MNIRVLLLGCLLALSVQAQESRRELWTWTDANGVTHFSDRPEPGARKVEIISTAPSATTATPSAAAAARPARSDAAAAGYRSLEIWQPEDGATFFGADATVNVRMRSEPDLASGDRLSLYLDGNRVEGASGSYEHTLANLPRGAHSLVAVIVDERGNQRIRSEPRVFHVQQPTVNPPAAVGPNLRPPATPTPRVPPNRAPGS